jgi:RNA polymerase sigma-70 factor (ECF subfamily)
MTGPWDDVDDVTILRAHVAGSSDAFAELVRRHRDRLWALALRTLADREEAADALQDALLAAHRAADRFRGDSAVSTWLHRIVVNACLDRARRRQARPVVDLPDIQTLERLGAGHAPPETDRETAMVVRQALAQLPDEQRIPLVLLDMQGYSVAEIAAMLGIAEGTVKSRCARGRARLALLLGHLRHVSPPPPASGAGHAPAGNPPSTRAVGTPAAPHGPAPDMVRSEEGGGVS